MPRSIRYVVHLFDKSGLEVSTCEIVTRQKMLKHIRLLGFKTRDEAFSFLDSDSVVIRNKRGETIEIEESSREVINEC